MSLKRRFHALDNVLVSELSQVMNCKELEDFVARVHKVENDVDERILMETRVNLSGRCVETKNTALLRIFARHVYQPAVGDDASHYLVILEGVLIETARKRHDFALAQFFSNIKAKVDRKQGTGINTVISTQEFEWAEQTFPAGFQANKVIFRVAGDKSDKACNAHFTLTFNPEAINKFRISETLRVNFPFLPLEVTEEELAVGVVQHAARNALFDNKDRRFITCDKALQAITDGLPLLQFTHLRSYLIKHLLPLDPVEFDLALSAANTVDVVQAAVSAFHRSPMTSSQLMSKIGGRSFDLEVLVRSDISDRYIAEMNKFPQTVYESRLAQSQLLARQEFIVREIREDIALLDELKRLAQSMVDVKPDTPVAALERRTETDFPQMPNLVDAIAMRPTRDNKGKTPAFTPGQPLRTINSALHSFYSYMDVGDDKLFHSSQPWLQHLCKSLEGEKRQKVEPAPETVEEVVVKTETTESESETAAPIQTEAVTSADAESTIADAVPNTEGETTAADTAPVKDEPHSMPMEV